MKMPITINDELYKLLKVRSSESEMSISAYIQAAIEVQVLEDIQDVKEVERRKNEPSHSFYELVAEFKKKGLLAD